MKIKLWLLGLVVILLVSCGPSEEPIAGKAMEAGVDISEGEALQLEDPCENIEQANEDLVMLAEAIAEAEAELAGLEIDLEFAKEDQTNVAEVEGLIKEQEEYLAELNEEMAGLQEWIAEC